MCALMIVTQKTRRKIRKLRVAPKGPQEQSLERWARDTTLNCQMQA